MANNGRPWTREEEAAIIAAAADGKKPGPLIGRSPDAIRHRLARLRARGDAIHIKRRHPWKPEDDAVLIRLKDQGMSQSQIAVATGRTTGSISSRIRDLRIHGILLDGAVGPDISERNPAAAFAMSAPWGPASKPGRRLFADRCGEEQPCH